MDALAGTGAARMFFALGASHLMGAIAEIPCRSGRASTGAPISTPRARATARARVARQSRSRRCSTPIATTLTAEAERILRGRSRRRAHLQPRPRHLAQHADRCGRAPGRDRPRLQAHMIEDVSGRARRGDRTGLRAARTHLRGRRRASNARSRRARGADRRRDSSSTRGRATADPQSIRGERFDARDRRRRRVRKGRRQHVDRDRHAACRPASSRSGRNLRGHGFFAAGVSVVLHPRNPYAPTAHCNYRYFEAQAPDGARSAWWFGGGADLTPYYPQLDDVRHFHATLRAACDRHDPRFYPAFKAWCDRYFYLKHRGETRGVGGIFYDYLDAAGFGESDDRTTFAAAAVRSSRCSRSWPTRAPRSPMRTCRWSSGMRSTAFGERERSFQLLRRGRYVEFNLIYDRGTHFGLQSGGRTESILMSLPPLVRWAYDERPEPGSRRGRAARRTCGRATGCGDDRWEHEPPSRSCWSISDRRRRRPPPTCRAYLDEFLMDPYVLDVPRSLRALLVRGLILPTRPAKSAAAYAKIWTAEGSPLVVISQRTPTALEAPHAAARRSGDALRRAVDRARRRRNCSRVPARSTNWSSSRSIRTTRWRRRRRSRSRSNGALRGKNVPHRFVPPFYRRPGVSRCAGRARARRATGRRAVRALQLSRHPAAPRAEDGSDRRALSALARLLQHARPKRGRRVTATRSSRRPKASRSVSGSATGSTALRFSRVWVAVGSNRSPTAYSRDCRRAA